METTVDRSSKKNRIIKWIKQVECWFYLIGFRMYLQGAERDQEKLTEPDLEVEVCCEGEEKVSIEDLEDLEMDRISPE